MNDDCSFTLTDFETNNLFTVSHFDSEDFAATNQKMHRWYLLKGENKDEVALLSQKWGTFIKPSSR